MTLSKPATLKYLIIAVVKRGCAKRDLRYKSMDGCEEQLTGGGFGLVLCLCGETLCNESSTSFNKNAALMIFATLLYFGIK